MVSFGTSYAQTREKTIGAIEEDFRSAFPEYTIRRAFTSKMIIKKLRERDGIEVDTVAQALEKLEEITDQGQTDTLPFYEALENSAKLLQKRAGEDEA